MWDYDSIIDVAVNGAGRHVARVQVRSGDEVRTLFFQFESQPSDAQVEDEAAKLLAHMNAEANPQPE